MTDKPSYIEHPNLKAIRVFEDIKSVQAFFKNNLQKTVYFYPFQPCHYYIYEEGLLGETQPFYVISQLNSNGNRCFVLYKIIGVDHLYFRFDRKVSQ